jgi:hypothetical protein
LALQGTLRDFSIAEIFQLIGQQQKTGLLAVTLEKQTVNVVFDRGRVVGAAEGDRGEDDRLAERLDRMGLLPEDKIRELRGAQKGSFSRVASLLAEQGQLTKEQITDLLRVEMVDILLRLFLWERGHYEFTARTVRFDPEFYIGVASDQLLLDGLRAKDEWPSIERSLPTLTAVPQRVEGSGSIEEEAPPGSPERAILDLVDGSRTLRAIIDRSRLGEFEACRILANLKARGYIQLAPRAEAPKAPEHWRANAPNAALAACAAAVIGCGLVMGAFLGPILGKATSEPLLRVEGPGAGAVFAENRRARIREALEIYRIERGRYPERLDALVKAGLLAPSDVRIPLHYEQRGAGYALL